MSRLLLDAASPTNESRHTSFINEASFDTNMVIILAALLCALICALGLNSIVRCALRCSRRFDFDTMPEHETVMRLQAITGLKKSELRQIPIASFWPGLNIKATDCLICLGEFNDGEIVRVLPKCNHGFHVRCVDTWLMSRSWCPTCRQPLLSSELPTTTSSTGQHSNLVAAVITTGELDMEIRHNVNAESYC
ncbi:RING-H2 finger protein ATL72-like [Rutidosis leptorrhynchoides]|uniref:RING-H2 finger protein ATL72-like n=1 Tax=Rutidosis leptorrhynchoides TaxID=125765 RepID=UPI003A9A3D85